MLVPGDAPVTTPVEEMTVATVVLPLLHMQPIAVLPSVVWAPTHICAVPLIADGAVFTFTVIVTVQPPAVV